MNSLTFTWWCATYCHDRPSTLPPPRAAAFNDLAPFQKLRAPGNRKEEWMFSFCISLLTGDDRGCVKRNEG